MKTSSYADDPAIIADNPEVLQQLLNQIIPDRDPFSLKIKTAKYVDNGYEQEK